MEGIFTTKFCQHILVNDRQHQTVRMFSQIFPPVSFFTNSVKFCNSAGRLFIFDEDNDGDDDGGDVEEVMPDGGHLLTRFLPEGKLRLNWWHPEPHPL